MSITPSFKIHANLRQPAVERASLPCLYSNISTRDSIPCRVKASLSGVEYQQRLQEEAKGLHCSSSVKLSQQQKKSASALAWNVMFFAERFGLDHLGFLTLTFADDVQDSKEAQRRFNSLRTHVLADRYKAHIRVLERQKSGRIHYHLLVALASDIRSGVDFGALRRGDYRSASLALRKEWEFWRGVAPAYGFGRTELLPIESTAEGIARYVGKYIGKHLEARQPKDKGVRLVEYSSDARVVTTRFSWVTKGARAWRYKVKLFASMMSHDPLNPIPFRSFTAVFGSRWAYHWRDFILALPEPHFVIVEW